MASEIRNVRLNVLDLELNKNFSLIDSSHENWKKFSQATSILNLNKSSILINFVTTLLNLFFHKNYLIRFFIVLIRHAFTLNTDKFDFLPKFACRSKNEKQFLMFPRLGLSKMAKGPSIVENRKFLWINFYDGRKSSSRIRTRQLTVFKYENLCLPNLPPLFLLLLKFT